MWLAQNCVVYLGLGSALACVARLMMEKVQVSLTFIPKYAAYPTHQAFPGNATCSVLGEFMGGS